MEIALGSFTIILQLPLQNIGMLIFLMALTTATYYYMRKLRKERTVKLGNFQTLKEVHGKKSIASPSILLVKVVMVVMLFLVATGSIQILSTEPVSNTDFILAMDNSQTMMIPDYPPDRLSFAKTTSREWMSRLPDRTNVSVMAFSGEVNPIKTNVRKPEAVQAISSIEADLDTGGTAIGDAINLGVNILSESDADGKKIVLITDGTNTVGMNVSAAIEQAREENVTVDIIGISSTDRTDQIYQNLSASLQETRDVSVEAPEIDSEKLRSHAESTGGSFYMITGQDFFTESLKKIVLKNETVELDSSYYVLIFISLLIILEMLLYSKFGAI